MGGLTAWLLLLCLVSLGKANFSPTITQFVFQVCENKPIGGVAFTILASDPESNTLTYGINGANTAFFEVDTSTGAVTVRSALDRESGVTMDLGVTVGDGENITPGKLTIILLDANDNSPIFTNPSFDILVEENTAVATSLFKFTADDGDEGDAGVVRFAITEIIPTSGSDLFEISEISGELKLKAQLNYNSLSTFYRLRVEARDLGGSVCSGVSVVQQTSIFSFVTVKDMPDLDPVFISAPYVGRVEENSPVDTSVLLVTALDQDKGINDNMIYSIEGSTVDGLFKISPNEGIISVASGIDREVTGDTITLTVKATESKQNIHGQAATATATVQISIVDVNDNGPQFFKCEGSCVSATQFTGEVFENSLGAISIGMTVKDPDNSVQTELSLEGVDKDVFSVEPSVAGAQSIVQLLVRQPENLDFEEKQEMVLKVIAVDKLEPTFQSTATVTITIKDTNDNSPTFPQDTYKLNVSEHSPAGTEVVILTAEDPDTMDAGKITYRLLPESLLEYFDVESNTGRVFVKNQNLLDRELRSLYSGTLQARDTDGKPGTAVLEITLTDINDQPPVINRASYREFVKEGKTVVVNVEATDGDEAGTENSQIVFSIEESTHSSSFSIDPNTGTLTNSGELDREALDPKVNGRINLTVIATDKGTPPLSSSVLVELIVEDVNDNSPKFKAESFSFSVKEGEKGAFVGSVLAEDLDQTAEFNRISFSIIDGSFGSFIVRTTADKVGYSGNIMVDPDIELDYETALKTFTLRVEAADLEQEKASVMVEVKVLDVNDERPEFKSVPAFSVKENTTMVEPVGKFEAQDKDTNHSLVYKLESVKCICSGELKPCSWFTVDQNGDVRVDPEQTVDYEECNQAVIQAQVVDLYTERGENNSVIPGEMVINIEDINDNTPQFIYSNSVFVVVSEGASKGTSVARVTASDLDSGENRQIEFKVSRVQFENSGASNAVDMRTLFEAVTTQQQNIYVGIIQTTEPLDLSLKGKYLVTVTATDAGGFTSMTVLDIFTIDESFQTELQFRKTVAEVEISLSEITRELTAATSAAVQILRIIPAPSASTRNVAQSVMFAYFIFMNGTALTPSEIEKRLSDANHFPQLNALGLMNIGSVPAPEQESNTEMYILMGVAAALVVVLVVLTTSLLCTRRNYKRKLKAANAMKSTTMLNSDNQKGGAVVPGTNMYTMEGANPVLNLNIDTAIALDMDLNEESSDMDKTSQSLNSLDLNENNYDNDTDDDKKGILWENASNNSSEYNEPLGAALAQFGQNKKSSKIKTDIGINNPMFSTTDL